MYFWLADAIESWSDSRGIPFVRMNWQSAGPLHHRTEERAIKLAAALVHTYPKTTDHIVDAKLIALLKNL